MVIIPLESICQLKGEAFSKEVLINFSLGSWLKAGEEWKRKIANKEPRTNCFALLTMTSIQEPNKVPILKDKFESILELIFSDFKFVIFLDLVFWILEF